MSVGDGTRGRILDTFAAHEAQKESRKLKKYTVAEYMRLTGYDTDIIRKKKKQDGLF